MNVIKRDGREVPFDPKKIKRAITLANGEVASVEDQLTSQQIDDIVDRIVFTCTNINRAIDIEEVQDIVESALMTYGSYEIAKRYIRYRYERERSRQRNSIDGKVLSLVNYQNEEVKQENSNKNPEIIPTQRDYIAGEVSKDITKRILLPEDIARAHEEGIIHFHDADYFIQPSHNCDLVNLEDMLENGTVISGTLIEKPHTFSTACNIATQIVAQVASCQYGGQTLTLSHLAPFVDKTRQLYKEKFQSIRSELGEQAYKNFIEQLVLDDVRRGIQTIQYQVVTLMTTNGQAPFVSIFMYLDEVPEGQTRDDLALLIEETLKQRLQGVKNEQGVWVTPAFPKLLYVTDEDNITEDSKYWYLTKLAAKCSAKRMVPDYISAKMMKELKGDVYPCMGKSIAHVKPEERMQKRCQYKAG